jgi:hypothetical protein
MMVATEHLALRPLPPVPARLVETLQHQGLLSGKTEIALVQALSRQLERCYQSRGQTSRFLTLDELARELELLYQTPLERQRALGNLQRVTWRVKAKLYLAEWVIASLHTGLGGPYLALFHFSEIGLSSQAG